MAPAHSRQRAFTLIELLTVVAILGLLIGILLPSLTAARATGHAVRCLANLRSIAEMTGLYLDTNDGMYPVRDNTVLGGGNLYNSFLPSRLIMRQDQRPLKLFACAADLDTVRLYPVGDGTTAFPDSMGIGDIYNLAPADTLRYSYGINNMTGIQPETEADRKLFNPSSSAYPRPPETLMYADSAYFNIRPSNLTLNDEPRLKGRVPNASAPSRMNSLGTIPPEYGVIQTALKRHAGGSNVIFMDHHGAMTSQQDCFQRILHSWTERWGTDAGAPYGD